MIFAVPPPHLNHDTSMGRTVGICLAIAAVMGLLYLLFGGHGPKK